MIRQDKVKAGVPAEAGRKSYYWEVRHAGLMGLKYLVAVRRDIFVSASPSLPKEEHTAIASSRRTELLQMVLQAALLGIRDADDDVRGTAASALQPLAPELVQNLPEAAVMELLDTLRLSLNDLKDDLSNSVASVLDLLGTLIQYPTVLTLLEKAETGWARTAFPLRAYG